MPGRRIAIELTHLMLTHYLKEILWYNEKHLTRSVVKRYPGHMVSSPSFLPFKRKSDSDLSTQNDMNGPWWDVLFIFLSIKEVTLINVCVYHLEGNLDTTCVSY